MSPVFESPDIDAVTYVDDNQICFEWGSNSGKIQFTPTEARAARDLLDLAIADAERKPHYDFIDFEPEPDTTGDGSGDPDKYILTLRRNGEEYALIVHRTCDGLYPLNGPLARQKVHDAEILCETLNR